LKASGLSILHRTGNTLLLKIEQPDFQLTAAGFDIHRDLFVRIDEPDSQPPAQEAS
jgi:hypothetical protein